jgi:hypothetical protein
VLIPSLDCVCHEHEHAHCVPSTFHIYRRTALVDFSRILPDCLIQYLVYPDHIYVVPMYCVIVQLYGNSFMAALNMRPYLRQTGQTRLEDTVRCDGDLALSPLQRTHHIATVNVFKETTVHRDLHLDVTDGKTQWNGPIEV